MAPPPFQFKRFRIEQAGAAHPVGTDGILLGAWADASGIRTALDIGTGTGLVALMLAQRTEAAAFPVQITGVDLHQGSCLCAGKNMASSPWPERLTVVQIPVQDFSRTALAQYDLIVSNPPYFTGTVVSPDVERRLSRNIAALSPGDLLKSVDLLLQATGRFCTIVPPAEGKRLCEWGAGMGLYCTKYVEIYTRKGKPVERLLLQFERDPYRFMRSELTIYENGEIGSPAFRQLTGAFYLA